MTAREAIDWLLSQATPPRPVPSAFTESAWLDHWRSQRHAVIKVLEKQLKLEEQ